MQKNIRNKQEELTHFITTEKMKHNRDQNKINKAQQHLQDIQNYKTTGSIIRSKNKLILEQEKLNKFFVTKKSKIKNKIQQNNCRKCKTIKQQ